ncbi:MAG TPA: N-acetyl-gamma-glutamyl-phosphate reductase [Firmicutes bacterium]|jgi:N-acetyl-gamma-glutamyl-phosphate reductase|nr:N-acetyl-gamma-glutamyl-phosphate reductase [Bacillota bacterium]
MVKAGIIGVNGYAGGELLRLLAGHPEVEVVAAASRSQAGLRLAEVFPSLRGVAIGDLPVVYPEDPAFSGCELFFLCTPHGVAAKLAPDFLRQGGKVIDLGADFRFRRVGIYEKWYKVTHAAPSLLAEAVYGLPELHREEIKEARVVGNPGCYPTAALLAMAPLLKADLVTEGPVIVDAKSGVSGAGRALRADLHYAEMDGDFRAYGLVGHRHTPEIEEEAGRVAGREVRVIFTPHLFPVSRGLFATIYLPAARALSDAELFEIYQDFYAGEPFVVPLPEPLLPQTKGVLFSNRCQVAARFDPRTGQIIVLSALDNMVKGAAGQAVQNMNILYGFDETLGLTASGIWP